MVKKPGLFNEAMEGFYRSTEAAARSRGLEPVIEEGDAP